MRLKVGQRLRVEVEALSPDGLGEATLPGGGRLKVEGGLPGEVGEALVTFAGRRARVARLERPERPSPERRPELPCPSWTPASPCRLMHLDDAAQDRLRRARVEAAFAAVGLEVGADLAPVRRASADLGWRHRTAYVVAEGPDGPVLGAFRRGSHVVQDMAGCPLEAPAVAEVIEGLRRRLRARPLPLSLPRLPVARGRGCGAPLELEALARQLARGALPPVDERPQPGLRYVLARGTLQGGVQLLLLAHGGALPGAEALAEGLRRDHPALRGVYLGESGEGDALIGPAPARPLGPVTPLLERWGPLRLEISPKAFFQVNPAAASALQAEVSAWVEGEEVGELFAGVGALGLRVAYEGRRLRGAEWVPQAVADAEANAAANGLAGQARFEVGDAAEALARWQAEGPPLDSLLLNPPRRGCGPELCEAIGAQGPAQVIYVSCNPASLARDVAILVERGYDIEALVPFDLFPHSEHVEVAARLRRVRAPAPT